MNYYLGPYQWIDDSWQPPVSTIGSIDLRNLTHMGTPIVQDGFGFFATTDLLDDSYDLLGQGDLREINSNSAIKSMWNSLLGYRPNGDKLVDLLYDQLTAGADPTGAVAVRPLMPAKGNLTVHLHGSVKSTQFRFGHSPESNKVISVLQEDYREIRNLAGIDLPVNHHRKVLDFWGEQYGVKNPHLLFIPNDLPIELPIPHSTSISENFDGANNAAVGKQLTWVEGGAGGFWDNFNNHARVFGAAENEDARSAYANSALSSADQQCQMTSVVQNNDISFSGVICRRSSSAVTYYTGRFDTKTPDDKIFVYKVITGTPSVVGSQVTVVESIPDTIKLTVAGSNLEVFFNGVSKSAVTDTGITGNLFCGLYGRKFDTVEVELDDWSAEDFIAPPPLASASSMLMGLL